jgi:sulfate adenylyltransferase subunit 1 (EFTu-like GTPase family)
LSNANANRESLRRDSGLVIVRPPPPQLRKAGVASGPKVLTSVEVSQQDGLMARRLPNQVNPRLARQFHRIAGAIWNGIPHVGVQEYRLEAVGRVLTSPTIEHVDGASDQPERISRARVETLVLNSNVKTVSLGDLIEERDIGELAFALATGEEEFSLWD